MNKARWIVVLTAITALLFTGVAYAGQGNSKGSNGSNENKHQNKNQVIEVNLGAKEKSQNENQVCSRQGFGPGEDAKVLREQIRERNRTIKENEDKCNQLKKQIKSRCQDMKRCVQQQRNQENAELGEDQATNINESLKQLKERNTELRNERICYNKQMANMKRNKRAGNKEALVEDLDNIIKAQNERIQALEETLNGLDTLDDTLNELK
ncbi:MAG TPA: hypothetical protein GX520_05810 [Syntrophaceticus sp.]|jgi:chromosome segregation ATPase|nr:hypothetical protein [Syntrophaceticus sp.]